jgi:hypothetical protein
MTEIPTPKDLKDKTKITDMVRWFSIPVLLIAARDSIVSSVFGSYADRRLVHAALNEINDDESLKEQYDYTQKIFPNQNGEIWIDYVADLGDGFNSTYAIAYLLGQKELKIENYALPRAQALIMGGDEVYPLATKEEYKRRLERPYNYAFPKSKLKGANEPYLFLIPGNHDWYDGLTLFLAKFCSGVGAHLGGHSSWVMHQTRSYFAIELPNNWWIWGIDTQLGEDIDQPQHDYFVRVAKTMSDDSKIILCASVPTWLDADSDDDELKEKFQRGIDHIASNTIYKNCKKAKIYAVISGDKHHYSRYKTQKTGTQFITSGGGGAFMHATHHLKDNISLYWHRTAAEQLTLDHKILPDGSKGEEEACFPTRKNSRLLATKNFLFPFYNWDFCTSLGIIYSLIGMILILFRTGTLENLYDEQKLTWFINNFTNIVSSPIFWGLLAVYYLIFKGYADKSANKYHRKLMGIFHGAAHLIALTLIVSFLPPLNSSIADFINQPGYDWIPKTWSFAWLMVQTAILGGVAGGVIWGTYLRIVSVRWGLHFNDASSALRIEGYKNFLRMRITNNSLTIYPIGLKNVPKRAGWKINPDLEEGNPNTPYILPIKPLKPEIIEGPIKINLKS